MAQSGLTTRSSRLLPRCARSQRLSSLPLGAREVQLRVQIMYELLLRWGLESLTKLVTVKDEKDSAILLEAV